ncbi:MAG TPA: M14 family zinc carboxypeptidase [Moheibacter sp.]|nr:M14 family zinc carboxypeptidase [Moheibacter sp.]
MRLIDLFGKEYERIRVEGFGSKYLPFMKLKNYLDENFPEKILIGKSFLGNDIYGLKIGTGKTKIMAWSQMHGNETTGTRCMLDVFSFLNLNNEWTEKLLKSVSFYFIPMLNPDGSTLYTRRNAAGIDLNRDFLQEASPEIKVLKSFVNKIKPDFLFNLHDQRTIFNVGGTNKPATLSFLAPSPDISRTETEPRIKAMTVINHIYKGLNEIIPGYLARFTDEFYSTSTGDNFMNAGYPIILFEAGHYPNDYQRNKVRKFHALAILLAVEKISLEETAEVGEYHQIPINDKKFLDIVLRNVLVNSNEAESLLDIGIYFEELLDVEAQEIIYCSRIEEIGDLSGFYGHLDIDKKGKIYLGKSSIFPKIGEKADFSVGNIHFEKGKFKD